MKIFRKASELEPNLVSIKDKGQSIGLVLTMGNLHDGHLSLIREAQLHNEFIICSIFINPTQFNNKDDFNSYPKTIRNDLDSSKGIKRSSKIARQGRLNLIRYLRMNSNF